MKRKPFIELELRDAFMFATVMADTEICRLTLERILGFPIREVRVDTEHVFTVNPDYRGVRLDARADDDAGTIYTIEMQVSDERNLPKRSRCYQSQIDVESLKPRAIFLNVKGENPDEVPGELVDFLHYVEKAELPQGSDDDFLRRLRQKISQIKHDRRMEGRYMTFGELLDQERREGHAEGLTEGHANGRAEERNRFLMLIDAMTADGRSADIPRLAKDVEFMEEMFAQYSITGNADDAQKV